MIPQCTAVLRKQNFKNFLRKGKEGRKHVTGIDWRSDWSSGLQYV